MTNKNNIGLNILAVLTAFALLIVVSAIAQAQDCDHRAKAEAKRKADQLVQAAVKEAKGGTCPDGGCESAATSSAEQSTVKAESSAKTPVRSLIKKRRAKVAANNGWFPGKRRGEKLKSRGRWYPGKRYRTKHISRIDARKGSKRTPLRMRRIG